MNTVNQPPASPAEDDLASLADAARSVAVAKEGLDTAVRLSRWAARGRPVTTTGVPRPGDAAQAARACGLAVPKRQITRAAQVPGLVEAWDLALATGLLELAGGKAVAGPNYDAWPQGADESVLSVWLEAFLVDSGLDTLDDDEESSGSASPGEALVIAAVLEALARGALSTQDLDTAVREAVSQAPDAAVAFVRASFAGDPVARAIESMEQWGVVEHVSGQTGLTALGGFVCRTLDLDPGEQIDPKADAASLLAALEADPVGGTRAAGAWLVSRSPRAAADQLLRAAAAAGPIGRLMAVTLMQELGDEALPAWKKAAKSAGIGPYARMALWEAGRGPEPSAVDGAWLTADLAVAVHTIGSDGAASAGTPEEFAADVLGDLDADERAQLAGLIRQSGHPAADTAIAVLRSVEPEGSGRPAAAQRSNSAGRQKAKTPSARNDVGYQLKITLCDVRPAIWRRVVVPDVTLAVLHEIVQRAMGWEDCHMHAFEARGTRYGHPDGGLEFRDEARARLSSVLTRPGDKLGYEYDFGDGWEHRIVLEKLVAPVQRPACTGGKRHCPPEDCGGAWGYEGLLEALADPEHEQHDELAEWMDGTIGESDFDPERFDQAAADRRVSAVRV